MAALTSDRNTEYSLGDLLSLPVAASTRIFAGSLVCVDGDGNAVPAADTSGLLIAGVATAQADNRNGSAGDRSVVVRRRGRYKFGYNGTLAQAAVGAQVYAVDDQTVDVADGVSNDVAVGVIDRVDSAGECWVSIDGAVLAGRAWSEPVTTTTTAGA
ncbi:MAG: hypothetical protein ACOC7T_05650 [Planctomycetota bacterium]